MTIPIETEYSKKGKTELVAYENNYVQFQVELFKEVWKEPNGLRAFHILIQLGENTIVLSSDNLWDVLHRAGKHLALLAAPKEGM